MAKKALVKKALGPWGEKSWDTKIRELHIAAKTGIGFEEKRKAIGSNISRQAVLEICKLPRWERARPEKPLKGDDLLWIRRPGEWYKKHGGLKAVNTLAEKRIGTMQNFVDYLVCEHPANFSAIEVGGGRFPLISRLPFKKIAFFDISSENLEETRKTVNRPDAKFIVHDVRTKLPIKKGSYRVCVLNEVLTHIGLRKQRTVLKQLVDKGITKFFISDRSTRGTASGNVSFRLIAVFLKRSGFNVQVCHHSAYTVGHFFILAEKTSEKPKIKLDHI